jgi:hypothetical protein
MMGGEYASGRETQACALARPRDSTPYRRIRRRAPRLRLPVPGPRHRWPCLPCADSGAALPELYGSRHFIAAKGPWCLDRLCCRCYHGGVDGKLAARPEEEPAGRRPRRAGRGCVRGSRAGTSKRGTTPTDALCCSCRQVRDGDPVRGGPLRGHVQPHDRVHVRQGPCAGACGHARDRRCPSSHARRRPQVARFNGEDIAVSIRDTAGEDAETAFKVRNASGVHG